jgi:hypothetical protein
MSMTDTTQLDPLEPLGDVRPDEAALAELTQSATGDPGAVPLTAFAEPVDYPVGTPTTAALVRLKGTARLTGGDVTQWSVFVKRLQSAKHWAYLHFVPEPERVEFIKAIPWRLEIAAQRSDLPRLLPDGMRLPAAYRIEEGEDERATIWMEDVAQSELPWDLDRFTRAATLLGRLSARRRLGLVEPLLPRPGVTTPGIGLRYYYQGRVVLGTLPALADDDTWHHPLLSLAICHNRAHTLRHDLLKLTERVPPVLDALDRLPQT